MIDNLLKENNNQNLSDTTTDIVYADAIRVGFIKYPSSELILKSISNQDGLRNESNKLEDIQYLNLSKWHFLEIGDICFCENLRILDLSNNYVTRIEPLVRCIHLVKLDLHENQISMLPDIEFWSTLNKLKILYLHGNPIIRLENLRRLSASSSLEFLTLFDTPLSLKKNYRHHVVNIIFSLKALDNYIISDEEIIEDAYFNNRFSALKEEFHRNIFLRCNPKNSYEEELKSLNELMANINLTLAHYSPVHIIQKNVRAYLDRKYFRLYHDALLWATIKIQRWWRQKKNLVYNNQKLHNANTSQLQANKKDLYGKSGDLNSTSYQSLSLLDENTQSKKRFITNTPASNIFSTNNIHIDLTKLNRSSSFLDHFATSTNAVGFDFDENKERSKSATTNTEIKHGPINILGRKKSLFNLKLISQKTKKFKSELRTDNDLGRLVSNLESMKLKPNILKPIKQIDEDDEKLMPYRLTLLTCKANLKNKNNLIVDIIKEKKFYHYSVQQLELDSHKRLYEERRVEAIVREPFKTNDQRLFQKIYGTIALGCLKAVDKAYADRQITEKRQKKHQLVKELKENREFNSKQIEYFKEERLKSIQMRHEKEKLHLTIAKRRVDLKPIQNKDIVQEIRFNSKNVNIDRQNDILFAREFNKQHLSVSKALQKHESNLCKEESYRLKTKFIENQKSRSKEQHEIVQNYLRQRTLLRIAKTNSDRQDLDYKLVRNYQSTLEEARSRVIKLKSHVIQSIPEKDEENIDIKNFEEKNAAIPTVNDSRKKIINSAIILPIHKINSSLSDSYSRRNPMPSAVDTKS